MRPFTWVDILGLVLAALTTFRVSMMITTEEGPFSLFDKFRNLFLKDNWVGRGVRCLWCVSFWAALVSVLMVYFELYWLLAWPAVSALSIILGQLVEKETR